MGWDLHCHSNSNGTQPTLLLPITKQPIFLTVGTGIKAYKDGPEGTPAPDFVMLNLLAAILFTNFTVFDLFVISLPFIYVCIRIQVPC